MDRGLRVLVVEDSEDDVILLRRQLKQAGYEPLVLERVETEPDMEQALASGEWDLIIADYSMPRFTAFRALDLVQKCGLDLPFIILSGNIGEDIAVAAMKAGAHDYIMKNKRARLIPAIERELREAAERKSRRAAEEALRQSEERYALAVQGANDGLWDWNLKSNEIYLAPRWKEMLGYREEDIGNNPEEWFSRIHPDDASRVKAEIANHLSGNSSHFENEHRMLHKDGSYRWILSRGLAVRDTPDSISRMAGSQTDITARKRAEEQLLHDAFHDGLTGLANRALFLDRLGLAIERTTQTLRRRKHYLFAVLFIDIDRFKIVNDSLGHVIGDELLIGVAGRLSLAMRPGDTVARLGGDEFAILVEEISDVSGAIKVANRVEESLALPFHLQGRKVFVTASIGIALSGIGELFSMSYARPEELLRDADVAMYRAKAHGKARYEIFDKEMHDRAVRLLHMETDLRMAIERKEFVVLYQPIVSLETGRIAGLESLVRWNHPQQGMILPSNFIPLAEETGLIVPLGRLVLNEVCSQIREWQGEVPPSPCLNVSVNLSSKQFTQPDLVEEIEMAIQKNHVEPAGLGFELTESMMMENLEASSSALLAMKTLGVQINIDDFGTGYSSLSYLHQFPIDNLKIDRSFISEMDGDPEKYEIVRAIVMLAHNLGMTVIAEGVETAEQLAHLKSVNCELAQGFYFSPPVDAKAARSLIQSRLSL